MGEAAEGGGKRYQGTVKAYDSDLGFGVVECADVKKAHDQDVLLLKSVYEGSGCSIGSVVNFSFRLNDEGLPEVTEMALEGPSSEPRPATANPSGDDTEPTPKWSLKLPGIGMKKEQTPFKIGPNGLPIPGPEGRPYPAYNNVTRKALDGSELAREGEAPTSKRPIMCSFIQSKKGCSMGWRCTFAHSEEEMLKASDGIKRPSDHSTKKTMCKFWQQGSCGRGESCSYAHGNHDLSGIYTGRVKHYSEEKRFGFLDCMETKRMFGRDVFLHWSDWEDAGFPAIGTPVTFQYHLNAQGMPQANNVQQGHGGHYEFVPYTGPKRWRAPPQGPPPQVLLVSTPNACQFCTGEYHLFADRLANGLPIWCKTDGRTCWLYSGIRGAWVIGGDKAEQADFACNIGWLSTKNLHAGAFPHTPELKWQWRDSTSPEAQLDPSIIVTVVEQPEYEPGDLVSQIKALQRSDPARKEAWWYYCDTHLGGVRDPAKHDESVLEAFLAESPHGPLSLKNEEEPTPAAKKIKLSLNFTGVGT